MTGAAMRQPDRKKKIQTKTTMGNGMSDKSRFRSVQIHANSESSCESARAIAGKRFLSSEVPSLPLDGCDVDDCRCTYELFHDRRTDYRRTSDVAFDFASQLYQQVNRRSSTSGRRRDDNR